ncbi:hypothetical protein TGARI_278580 [Toxoplasma gondii ARI]|uniref:Transmembrane protein n=1 Tax=Toxoplasma gondii ARI TaxID=1074872 RepID=A0A139XNT7_TOXGO|nr:hypothetical protein TGARI_278580 [Toxoplasma gondii ARI]
MAILFVLATGVNLSLFGLGVLLLFSQVAGVVTVAIICLLLVAEAYASCVAIALAADRIRAIRESIAGDDPHAQKLPEKHCETFGVALPPLRVLRAPAKRRWKSCRKSESVSSRFVHSSERLHSRSRSTTPSPLVPSQNGEKRRRDSEASQLVSEEGRGEQKSIPLFTDTQLRELNDAREPSRLAPFEGFFPFTADIARATHDEEWKEKHLYPPEELPSTNKVQQPSPSPAEQANAGCVDQGVEKIKLESHPRILLDKQTLSSSCRPKSGRQRHHDFEKEPTKCIEFGVHTSACEKGSLPHVRLGALYKRCRWCNQVVDKSSRHSFRLATCVGHCNRKSNIAQVALRLIRVSFLFLCAAAAWTKSLFFPDSAAAALAEARRHFPIAMDVPTVSRCCLVATLSLNISLVLYLLHMLTRLLCIHQSLRRKNTLLETASVTIPQTMCPTCSSTVSSSHCRACASLAGYPPAGFVPSAHTSLITKCSTASMERHSVRPHFSDCCLGWGKPGFAEVPPVKRQLHIVQSPAARIPDATPTARFHVETSHSQYGVKAAKHTEIPGEATCSRTVTSGSASSRLPSSLSGAPESAVVSVARAIRQQDSSTPSAKNCHFYEGAAHRSSHHHLKRKRSTSAPNFRSLQSAKDDGTRKVESGNKNPAFSMDKHPQPRSNDDSCSPCRFGTSHPRAEHTGDLEGRGFRGSRNHSTVAFISSEPEECRGIDAVAELFQERSHQRCDEGLETLAGGVTGDKQGISSLPTPLETSFADETHIFVANASIGGQGGQGSKLTDSVSALKGDEKEKHVFCRQSVMQSTSVFDTMSSSPIPSEGPDDEKGRHVHVDNEICVRSEALPFSLDAFHYQDEREVMKQPLSSISKDQQPEHSQDANVFENCNGARVPVSCQMDEESEQGGIGRSINVTDGGVLPRMTKNEIGAVQARHELYNQNQKSCELVDSDDTDENLTAWMKLQRLRELLACLQLRQRQRLGQQLADAPSPELTMMPTRVLIEATPEFLCLGKQKDETPRVSRSASIC